MPSVTTANVARAIFTRKPKQKTLGTPETPQRRYKNLCLTVYDLNRDQLNELKQTYAATHSARCSWGDLANDERIPDHVIIEEYEGFSFSPDDFFCSAGRY